ncbi:MAG: UMP kinase [Halobacteriaceae archaeon]
MKVVVSIGGSVLAPDLETARIEGHARAIEALVEAGWDVGVVVGGGPVARDYIDAGRRLGANEIQLDQIGIEITRLNARLLLSALSVDSVATPAPSYEEAGEAMRHGDVAVMGGVAAGQTTDAVSAALAEYTDASLLIYATSVPGVFSADPNEDSGAERYDRLSGSELVDVIAGIEMSAGSSAPVDILAAKLIERSRVRTIVLDGTDPEAIVRAVLEGTHDGTDIVPESSSAELPHWQSQEPEA